MPEATEMLVLHTVRLTGVVATEVLAERLHTAPPVVEEVLRSASARGLCRHVEGHFAGWSLTTEGRSHTDALLGRELDGAGTRAALEAAYEGFRELNQPVLAACSAWQIVDTPEGPAPNDHSDADHDAAVLRRLAALHEEARRVLHTATGALARFGQYEPRLTNALDRANAGGLDWVTRPVIDSYHTVWFELHEDLLATLGRRRTDERTPPDAAPAGPDGGAGTPRQPQDAGVTLPAGDEVSP